MIGDKKGEFYIVQPGKFFSFEDLMNRIEVSKYTWEINENGEKNYIIDSKWLQKQMGWEPNESKEGKQ